MGIEPKFKKGDFIINRSCGDMAIVKGVTKKNYYEFEAYYSSMFRKLKDLKRFNYLLQVNYQKFFDFCNDEEIIKLKKIMKEER